MKTTMKCGTAAITAILLASAAGAGIAKTDLFTPERVHATPQMQQEFPDLF